MGLGEGLEGRGSLVWLAQAQVALGRAQLGRQGRLGAAVAAGDLAEAAGGLAVLLLGRGIAAA